MPQETDELLETISSMMSMSRVQCADCEFVFYGSAKYNEQSQKTTIRGNCPQCGSTNLTLLGG